MTGTTIAQAIPIAISPILTRLYSPDDFGVFALFVAITTLLGNLTNGKYELAIMLPRKEEDAINITALGFIITVLISLMLLIFISLAHDYLVGVLNNEGIRGWLYLAPITVFFIGFFNLLTYFNNRKGHYKDIANATIIKSVVAAIVQLTIGFMKSGATGLISGQLMSQLFANMRLIKNIVKDKEFFSKISKIRMLRVAKRYNKFPKFEILSGMLNTGSSHLPTLLFSVFFNSTVVGFYSLSHRVLALPMGVVGNSVGQVFLQKISTMKQDRFALYQLVKGTFEKLFLIGLIPMVTIATYGDYLFTLIFGSEWLVAGQYSQLLSLWLFLVFVTSPLSRLLIVLEKQRELFLFNVSIFIFRSSALLLGYYVFSSVFYSVMLYSVVGALFWLGLMIYIFRISAVKFMDIYKLVIFAGIVLLVFFLSRLLVLNFL